MTVNVYSDASYCDKNKIGSCGFVIINKGRIIKHQVTIISNINNSSDSEVYSAYLGLIEAYGIKEIKQVRLFTDAQIVVAILNGRVGTKIKNKIYDELKEVSKAYSEMDIILKVQKVRAHSNDKYNNKIDISVRKHLRLTIEKLTSIK
jgi:ribonuclease HI